MMVTRHILLVVAIVLMCGCTSSDRNLEFTSHIDGDLPATATLVNSDAQYAGLDASYGFVFNVSDNALLDRLIVEWKLKRSDSPCEAGFFKFAQHAWWPTDKQLSGLVPSYGRSDSTNEEYWNVWPDPQSGKLYVEFGRW